MKYFTLYIVFVFTSVYAQNITNQNLNYIVHGIVYQGNEQYLITDNGYVKVQSKKKSVNDQWTDYYRKAYGDSTIQNPNTIIEQPSLNIPIQFFHPINGKRWYDKEVKFDDKVFLYDFIEMDDSGVLTYKPGVIEIIGNMQKIKNRK